MLHKIDALVVVVVKLLQTSTKEKNLPVDEREKILRKIKRRGKKRQEIGKYGMRKKKRPRKREGREAEREGKGIEIEKERENRNRERKGKG